MKTRNTGYRCTGYEGRKKEERRKELGKKAWKIEEYYRGIKQFCGVERCQARRNNMQRAHIMMAIRAFLRFEIQRI